MKMICACCGTRLEEPTNGSGCWTCPCDCRPKPMIRGAVTLIEPHLQKQVSVVERDL